MRPVKSALEGEIRRMIAVAGPMPVARYMELCLSHPRYGYYSTRDPLGRDGDFITAPEVSQMFGELIGLWTATVWQSMGAPDAFNLVELGPGRGTMMRDVMRAGAMVPGFRDAARIHLVEVSPALRERQKATLASHTDVAWHDNLHDVPQGACIILANEFVDALPVHQIVKQKDAWHERMVGIGDDDNLAFGLAPDPLPQLARILPKNVRDARDGEIFEFRADHTPLEIGRRVARDGGAALVIDYGHVESNAGDTLQAVGGHEFADLLNGPGLVDLTAHVDFAAFAQAAESMGARISGPVDQGDFLRHLGIVERAVALKERATDSQRETVQAALTRLTQSGRTGMGTMFKVVGIGHADLGRLPGL